MQEDVQGEDESPAFEMPQQGCREVEDQSKDATQQKPIDEHSTADKESPTEKYMSENRGSEAEQTYPCSSTGFAHGDMHSPPRLERNE